MKQIVKKIRSQIKLITHYLNRIMWCFNRIVDAIQIAIEVNSYLILPITSQLALCGANRQPITVQHRFLGSLARPRRAVLALALVAW